MGNQTLTLPSSTKSICQLEEFIQCVAKEYNICQDKFPDILISLTEAVNNAIIHGNKEREDKQVRIVFNTSKKGLIFTVHDEGKGFNPTNLPDPTSPERLTCCGGRGVFLMNQLADEVKYLNNGRSVKMHFIV